MVPMDNAEDTWFDHDPAGCRFAAARLLKRLDPLLAPIGGTLLIALSPAGPVLGIEAAIVPGFPALGPW
jgi:hypothetical protein